MGLMAAVFQPVAEVSKKPTKPTLGDIYSKRVKRKMNKLYISIDEAKEHLNIDQEFMADDLLIARYIQSAQEALERNIDRPLSDFEDEYGNLPEGLLQAIRFMVANFYANRENVAFTNAVNLPYSYQYLVDLYRDYKGVKPKCNKEG